MGFDDVLRVDRIRIGRADGFLTGHEATVGVRGRGRCDGGSATLDGGHDVRAPGTIGVLNVDHDELTWG